MARARIILISLDSSFNISSTVGKENIGQYSVDDFICIPNFSVELDKFTQNHNSSPKLEIGTLSIVNEYSISYNSSTGAVTVTNMKLRLNVSYSLGFSASKDWEIPAKVYMLLKS